jgi:hypothetical protein
VNCAQYVGKNVSSYEFLRFDGAPAPSGRTGK